MLRLDRRTLADLLQNNQQAISAFERMFADVGGMLPSSIEEANALAGTALAMAQASMATMSVLAEALAQLEGAPALLPQVDQDDTTPRVHLGTMSGQSADNVEITGGTAGLDAGSATTPSLYFGTERGSGLYRSGVSVIAVTIAGTQRAYFDTNSFGVWGSVSASQQLISNAPAGTPPLAVSSSTRVANLNVDRAALADTAVSLANPTNFPPVATDAASTQTLVNALRAAAIAKGL